ncbi:NAD(P)H-binding protein [Levilactobacillus acidifarinae]|uniref:Oxidoreductase n=1 Tax=Levilactobacillus acidifarinae DSM 19394 = JCM 15949 TaxID=1423715 RepID=A0A0R1LJ52_9LACO|nr:NAD(P)H-binding protein [Levilactobacillus acidifarinae]KRK95926.1 oxidoreductase [Levilactobacillus acidifarinae DSM 19394]GEO69229.1 NAD-dependent dehydratase [Levilactobacillus acidifarinae]
MKNILIIGATSRIAQWAERTLLRDQAVQLTLFLRDQAKLPADLKTAKILVGDATDSAQVTPAIQGQDVVYASLEGDVVTAAKTLVTVMNQQNVKRLIWTSSLGIYDEVPGKFGELNNRALPDYLKTYRAAADIIEASDLAYTIIRPAWLTNDDEVSYTTTHRHDAFVGTEVSRQSIAAYAVSLIQDPTLDVRDSVGVSKPGTDGDRPRVAVMTGNGFDPDM